MTTGTLEAVDFGARGAVVRVEGFLAAGAAVVAVVGPLTVLLLSTLCAVGADDFSGAGFVAGDAVVEEAGVETEGTDFAASAFCVPSTGFSAGTGCGVGDAGGLLDTAAGDGDEFDGGLDVAAEFEGAAGAGSGFAGFFEASGLAGGLFAFVGTMEAILSFSTRTKP